MGKTPKARERSKLTLPATAQPVSCSSVHLSLLSQARPWGFSPSIPGLASQFYNLPCPMGIMPEGLRGPVPSLPYPPSCPGPVQLSSQPQMWLLEGGWKLPGTRPRLGQRPLYTPPHLPPTSQGDKGVSTALLWRRRKDIPAWKGPKWGPEPLGPQTPGSHGSTWPSSSGAKNDLRTC